MAVILDLDDTIFETKSMDASVFEPFFNHLSLKLNDNFDPHAIENIIKDLWQRPFDIVFKKYNISLASIESSFKLLESLELDLKISFYQDYSFIRNLQTQKFLVTTGLSALQKAKIKTLCIEKDFTKIIINDPIKDHRTKQDIFVELITEFNLIPENTFVIGDNADSEIKAGNFLNMNTIQILRKNIIKGNNAKYYIKSFTELKDILKL